MDNKNEEKICVINEIGDMGLGVKELTKEEKKILQEQKQQKK